jgi:hypothetical protein
MSGRGKVRAGSKAGRQIQRELQALGYRLVHMSNTKHGILDPEGRLVRSPSGVPLMMANSPSSSRFDRIMRQRLREAGVPIREA